VFEPLRPENYPLQGGCNIYNLIVHLALLVALDNHQDKVHANQSLVNDKRSNAIMINCPRAIKPKEKGKKSQVPTKTWNLNHRYMYSIIIHGS
jgi:hypothetical protein